MYLQKLAIVVVFIINLVLIIPPFESFAIKTCGPSFYSPIAHNGNPLQPAVVSAADMYKVFSISMVTIDVSTTDGDFYGSGIIFDTCGDIVTNNHVISGAKSVYITLSNGQKYPGTIIGNDFTNDISVIRLPDTVNFPYYSYFANFNLKSGDLYVGQKIFAIGNPGSILALTEGIISNLNTIVPSDQGFGEHPVIVFDAKINHGSSGGALLNEYGFPIGITEGGFESGLEIAIPHYIVVKSILQILANHYHNTACAGNNIPSTPNLICVDSNNNYQPPNSNTLSIRQ